MYRRKKTYSGWVALLGGLAIIPLVISIIFFRINRPEIIEGVVYEPTSFQIVPRATGTPRQLLPITGQGSSELAPTSTPQILPCTYTRVYWRENPQSWLTENIIVGNYSFLQSDIVATLNDETGVMPMILLQEFFTTVLNVIHGANPTAVETSLEEAGAWLGAHLLQGSLTEEELQAGAALARSLENYNMGLVGPGLCPNQPPTPTLMPTATPMPTATLVPTPTRRIYLPPVRPNNPAPTQTPGATATPGEGNTPPPTQNPLPSSTQPVAPTSTPGPGPTRTPQPTSTTQPANTPKPSNTPKPTNPPEPTSPPEPTNTPRPSITPRPTKTDKPTKTPRD